MSKNNTALPSAFSLFTPSWEAVKKNGKTFAILYAIPLLLALPSLFNDGKQSQQQAYSASASSITGGLTPLAISGIVGLGIIVIVAVVVLSFLLQTMMFVAELRSAKHKKISFSETWDQAKPFLGRIILLSIATAFILAGGLILFIVPFFFALRRYVLAPYFLIDKNLSVGDALKESAKASKPYAGAIWGLIGVMLLLSLTAIIPIVGGLVSFGLGLAYSVAPAMRYYEIKKAGY